MPERGTWTILFCVENCTRFFSVLFSFDDDDADDSLIFFVTELFVLAFVLDAFSLTVVSIKPSMDC